MICYSDATVPSSNRAVKSLIRFVSRFTRGVVEVVLQIDFIWYSKLVVKGQKSFREFFYTGGPNTASSQQKLSTRKALYSSENEDFLSTARAFR